MSLGGGDPRYQTTDRAASIDPRIEAKRQIFANYLAEKKVDEVLVGERWSEVESYFNKLYKTIEETGDPAQVDLDEIAGMRQRLAQIDSKLRPLGTRVWDHPRTRIAATVLATNSPLVVEGDRTPTYGMYYPLHLMAEAGGGIQQLPFQMGLGILDLGTRAVDWLRGGNGDTAVNYPEIIALDKNGKFIHTKTQIEPMEMWVDLWNRALGKNAQEAVRHYKADKEWEVARRSGLDDILFGSSHIAGSLVTFAPTAGAMMGAGQLASRSLFKSGIGWLATLGRGRHAAKITKALEIVAGTSGAMGGNALLEGVAYGKLEGYGKATLHGAAMGGFMMGIGAVSRRTAMLASKRMPESFAKAVGLATEAVGFGTLQTSQVIPLWRFVQDPNNADWSEWGKNILMNFLGLGAFKGLHGVMPSEVARGMTPEMEATQKGKALAQQAGRDAVQRRAEREEKIIAEQKFPHPSDTRAEILRRAQLRAGREPKAKEPIEPMTPEEFARFEPPKPETFEPTEPTEMKPQLASMRQTEATLSEGRRLTFEETGPGRQEWKVRDAEGRLIGGGSLTVDGKKARIWSARVIEEFRNKGIYTEVRREMERRFPEGVTSIEQEPAAKRVQEKVEGVSRETFEKLGEGVLAEARGEVGAAAQARREARIEQEGLLPEQQPEAVRERLHETLSARGEFPAEGVAPTPEGVPGTEPIRARDVMLEGQVGPIRPAVRRKGMGQAKRWAKGYYSTREDLIRMEGSRDLNNFAHEWGHALWGKVGDSMGLSMAARSQLLEIGQPTSTAKMTQKQKLHEGMAEFVARRFLGDAELATKYPLLFSEITDFLARPEQASVLDEFQRLESAYQRWRDQGLVEQVRQSVVAADAPMSVQEAQFELGKPLPKGVTPSVKVRLKLRRAWQGFRQHLVDDQTLARDKIYGALKRSGIDPHTLPITDDPIRMTDALKGKASNIMSTMLFKRAMGFGGKETGVPSLRNSLEGVIKPEERLDLMAYAVARRSLEALDKGLDVQLSRQAYLAAIDHLGNPRFEQGVQALKGWFDNLVDYAIDGGSLTIEAGNRIKDAWVVYIPFFRALQGPMPTGGGRGVAERPSGFRRMFGEEIEIQDPLETAIELGTSIISEANKAASMKALYNLHLTTKGMGDVVTVVPREMEAKTVTAASLASALRQAKFEGDAEVVADSFIGYLKGLDPSDAASILTIFSQKTVPSGSRPVLAFVPRYTEAEIVRFEAFDAPRAGFKTAADQLRAENGKILNLELDPDVFESVMGVDASHGLKGPIAKFAAKAVAWQRLGLTVINPEFWMRQIFRDPLIAATFSQAKNRRRFIPVAGAVASFTEGAFAQVTRAPIARKFSELGGFAAGFMGGQVIPAVFGKRVMSKSLFKTNTLDEARRKILEFFAAPERTMRIVEGKKIHQEALDAGKSELEANFLLLEAGQEITTNFLRGGGSLRALSQFVVFLNARMQGLRQFSSHAFGAKGRRAQLSAIMQGISNLVIPSFILHLMFRDDDEYQDRPDWQKLNYWTIPESAFGVSLNIPKPFELGKVFSNPVEMISEHFSEGSRPVELSEWGWDIVREAFLGFDYMPSILGPSIESISNYDFFRQRPIVPEWMQRAKIPAEQYTAYTTGIAKMIGKFLNVSPAKTEHWLTGHTGGLGLYAMRAVDLFTGDIPEGNRDWDLGSAPFISALLKGAPHKSGHFAGRVYDIERELTQLKGSDAGTSTQLGFLTTFRNIKSVFSDINRQVRTGVLTRDEGNRQKYELARPVVEAYERSVQ